MSVFLFFCLLFFSSLCPSSCKKCQLRDLSQRAQAISSSPPTWAIISLVRARDVHQNTQRNTALAVALKPFAKRHSLSILFFSEDEFSAEIVDAWKETFTELSRDVQLINVRSRGYDTSKGKIFGFKWMCKFFTVDLFEFIQNYTYFLRVDSDNILSPLSYDIFDWVETNQVEYGYVLRKLEPHQLTVNTLPTFVQKYLEMCSVVPRIQAPPLTRKYVFNFYNNFHVGKVSFFTSPRVRHFLVSVNASHLQAYRWGDSTIQAYAVRLFMSPSAVQEMPNITYRHLSHGNALISSDPQQTPSEIPQYFPSAGIVSGTAAGWTNDPELSMPWRIISHKNATMLPHDPSKT